MTALTYRSNRTLMTAADFGIELGSTAVSADGKRLGTISDVLGTYFKVHRGLLRGDSWFEVDNVVDVLDDEVVLNFDKNASREHEVPSEMVDDQRLDSGYEQLLDEIGQLLERARAEHELRRRS